LSLCFLIAFAGFVALALLGARTAPTSETIEARKIVLVDEAGKPRMTMAVTALGPSLVFSSDAGVPKMFMGVGGGPGNSDGLFLNFRGENGLPRLTMGVLADGDGTELPYLTLSDKRGLAMLRLELDSEAKPRLSFYGHDQDVNAPQEDGKLIIGVNPANEPCLKRQNGKDFEVISGLEKRNNSGKPAPPQ
jgi:hypothetical protein